MGADKRVLVGPKENIKMSPLGFTRFRPGTKEEKHKMKKSALSILPFLLVAILVAACGDRSENRQVKQAAEIHKEIMQRHDSIYNSLTTKQKWVTEQLESERNEKMVSAYRSMDRSLDRGFKLLASWESAVVGVPGVPHKHHPGHTHSHDEDIVDRMSDKELLDLQKAYKARLDEVEKKVENLLETIDTYMANAK